MTRHFALALYDHLGRAVVLNLVWLVAALPWITAGAAIAWAAAGAGAALGQPALGVPGVAAAVALVALSPATYLVAVATVDWLGPDGGDLAQAWRRTRSQALRVQAVGVGVALLVAGLLGNALFYQTWGGWLGLALSGVMLWLAAGVAAVAVLLLPLLATRPEAPLRRTAADAALLALVHPAAAAGLLAGTAVGLALGAATVVGLCLGGVPALTLWGHVGLRTLLARHGEVPLTRDPRGWRDLLRPWQ